MNKLSEIMNVEIPIIQAGMAGGITTPELVAAVSNEGALGTIGAGYLSASSLKEAIRGVKSLTNKPFAVNLFAANLEVFTEDIQEMQAFLNTIRTTLEIDSGNDLVKVNDYLQEKIYIIIQENVPVVSTAFGSLSSVLIERLKDNNVKLIGMATNLNEAKQLEDAGYDLVVAQGYEAGGHRGTFDTVNNPNGSDIGLITLVQSFIDQINIPIVAAGGIYRKEQIDALIQMGAAGVQLGTVFLMAKEAGTNPSYRRAIIKAEMDDTVITRSFTGRPARLIHNSFVQKVEESKIEVLPFPIQNELTKDIRAAGSEFAIANVQALFAGQGVGALKKEETVEEIIAKLT
ncbi:2-nitropropane dioxygenase [Oceanobacillus zhaokaii]|uniref:Probable nitronate monooxygenase n=1 Tax=Oceanobacillus zhaokaii TaxID=2052660 RepID=A0A345PL49_9BACI|nr:nitronate monooxygenase [Oceanobacillus zhaokaii]AXI10729.1 2-nitropropane dioxygenase [Oceanobacillus zhaokaii]